MFDVTPMTKNPHAQNQRLIQKWFPGDHGCVGGGTEANRGLSDGALQWMIDSIKDLGLALEFDIDAIFTGIQPDYHCPFNKNPGFFKLAGIKLRDVGDVLDELHDSTIERVKTFADYRPKNLETILSQIVPT